MFGIVLACLGMPASSHLTSYLHCCSICVVVGLAPAHLPMLQLQEAQAAGQQGYEYVVDKDDVKRRVEDLLKKQDLSKFVL